jgi:predicted RecA/RadA family phage recombinase
MNAEFVQAGDAIDYVPVADMAAGDVVVQGELVGVAKRNYLAGELSALAVTGLFDFPKAVGGGSAIAAGANVFWDVGDTEAKEDSEAGANKLVGKVALAAGDNDATVRVRLDQ